MVWACCRRAEGPQAHWRAAHLHGLFAPQIALPLTQDVEPLAQVACDAAVLAQFGVAVLELLGVVQPQILVSGRLVVLREHVVRVFVQYACDVVRGDFLRCYGSTCKFGGNGGLECHAISRMRAVWVN